MVRPSGVLVIVPCGRAKIWDKNPAAGPTSARDAYVGAPFKVNREYAERFGDAWVILSAKYGFVGPEHIIAGPYDVTFKRSSTGPIDDRSLQRQIRDQMLDRFDEIIALGGADYRARIEKAFASTGPVPRFPFAGLPLGRLMQAT